MSFTEIACTAHLWVSPFALPESQWAVNGHPEVSLFGVNLPETPDDEMCHASAPARREHLEIAREHGLRAAIAPTTT